MTPDEYVKKVLNAKRADSISLYDTRLTAIKGIIRDWAGQQLSEIKLSGSCSKKTAIKGKADCDLFISLKSDTTETLKEIYNKLEQKLKDNYYFPRKQNVSLRILTEGLEIDLVPAKIMSGYKNYHSIYQSNKDSWTQTNIDLHIKNVNDSNRNEEILATKIWKDCMELNFPSIYIELVVISALKNKNTGQPATNFITVLNYLKDSFVDSKFTDPANSNNVISDMIYKYEKEEIQKAAKKSLEQQYWENIIW